MLLLPFLRCTELADRHHVLVSDLAVCRGEQAAGGGFLDVLTPPGHHRSSAFNVVGSVVGAAHFILVDMCQCDLNEFGVLPMFIQDGAGHRAHAVADQAILEAHALQRHVGRLAIGVGTWISIGREDVFAMAAVSLQ